MGALRTFMQANRVAAQRFNAWFPGRASAMEAFQALARSFLHDGMSLVDIGGGRHPFIGPAEKRARRLTVVGVDIDANELRAAPLGAYDRVVVADCTRMDEVPAASADLVYSRAVAEHVPDPEAMFAQTRRVLKPGGISIHYVPNKWALFALVNAALPTRLSRRLLYALHPGSEEWAGFTAFYRDTYPRAMERLFSRVGFRDVRIICYYQADYLNFALPAHVLYVAWQNLMRRLHVRNLCESFAIVGVS